MRKEDWVWWIIEILFVLVSIYFVLCTGAVWIACVWTNESVWITLFCFILTILASIEFIWVIHIIFRAKFASEE